MARCLDRLALKEPLEHWSDETVELVVKTFINEKFPTVYALNKIDHPDADKVYLYILFYFISSSRRSCADTTHRT